MRSLEPPDLHGIVFLQPTKSLVMTCRPRGRQSLVHGMVSSIKGLQHTDVMALQVSAADVLRHKVSFKGTRSQRQAAQPSLERSEKSKGMVLPFRPLNMAFSHMYYSVDLPSVSAPLLFPSCGGLLMAVLDLTRTIPAILLSFLQS